MQQPGGSPQGRGHVEAAGGPGLPEVIQNSARNRFSGRILVSQDGGEGVIFFRDGEVVHAEWGDRTGEEAFYEILQTPSAPYALEPKVTSAVRTIDRTWKALLLEAARLVDERRRGQPRAPVPEAAREKLTALVERIRRIPGVVHATLQSKDEVDASGAKVETGTLEGQSIHLAQFGKRYGELFGTGEMVASVVQGDDWNLLLLATKSYHLSILMEGASEAGVIESEIRKLLAARR
jgi:predicted regulator of Ras-like GTPase activity (Roadblock/LC7/MglB family)